MRSVDPALSEADVTRERLALEEAIRKVESEAARRSRADDTEFVSAPPGSAQAEPKPSPTEPTVWPSPAKPEAGAARKPPIFPEPDRAAPRLEPEGIEPSNREATASPEPRPSAAKPRSATSQTRSRHHNGYDEPDPLNLDRRGGVVRKVVVVAILIAIGVAAAFAYRERSSIVAFYQSLRGSPSQAARDTAQSRGKISDRIGPGGQQDTAPGAAPAGAAQRVMLYEQQPNTTERKQYVGSVTWRTETVAPGPGMPSDIAVKADVEIPERHLRMTWTLRRNTDQTLPASHTIEVMFNVAPDFPSGGVADVPGVLMEQAEQTRGVPLTGIRVKVTNGFFLVGLSAVEPEVQRNIQLLKERPWLDIPIVYNDGNRALLAIEKGAPGERVFADAFTAWGQ